jgi:hypothetical protein
MQAAVLRLPFWTRLAESSRESGSHLLEHCDDIVQAGDEG